jgi:hypothetical protein
VTGADKKALAPGGKKKILSDPEVEQYMRERRVRTQHDWFMREFVVPAQKEN